MTTQNDNNGTLPRQTRPVDPIASALGRRAGRTFNEEQQRQRRMLEERLAEMEASTKASLTGVRLSATEAAAKIANETATKVANETVAQAASETATRTATKIAEPIARRVVEEGIADYDKKLREIQEQIERSNAEFKQFGIQIEEEKRRYEEEIGKLNSRVDTTNARIDNIDDRLSVLYPELEKSRKDIIELMKTKQIMEERINYLIEQTANNPSLADIHEVYVNLKKMVDTLDDEGMEATKKFCTDFLGGYGEAHALRKKFPSFVDRAKEHFEGSEEANEVLDEVEKNFEASEKANKILDEVEKNFEASKKAQEFVDSKLSEIDSILADIDSLTKMVLEHDKKLQEHSAQLDEHGNRLDGHDKEIGELKKNFENLSGKVDGLILNSEIPAPEDNSDKSQKSSKKESSSEKPEKETEEDDDDTTTYPPIAPVQPKKQKQENTVRDVDTLTNRFSNTTWMWVGMSIGFVIGLLLLYVIPNIPELPAILMGAIKFLVVMLFTIVGGLIGAKKDDGSLVKDAD